MPPEERIRWQHMIDAAEDAMSFMSGRTRADLDRDRMLLFAVVRAIEIIGEAASKITPQTRTAHPEIPWPAIIGMRNRLVHAYFEIDTDLVWVAVTKEVPRLLAQLKAIEEQQGKPMAMTNHERVGKALSLLRAGLGPFVERELKARYGDDWAFEAKEVLSDTRLGAGRNASLHDVAAMLVIMDRKQGDVFRHILGKTELSLVNEIIAVRNRWALQEPFSSDDAYRALDSAERLLSAVSCWPVDCRCS